ncbi:MAG: Asp-tRNA(Asn)/Glu-tRNA(Gln) amidotransferase subunit GatC [Acidobacteriota bacterium]
MPGGSGDFDVVRLAALARLTLDPGDQVLYARQLAEILTFAGEVLAVDTAGVPPTTHALTPALPEREDAVEPSFGREIVADLAPTGTVDGGLIRVARVIER